LRRRTWFYGTTMFAYHDLSLYGASEPGDVKRAAAATFVLLGLVALFTFAAPRDPTKVVAGLPCSVLSEASVSATFDTEMRLMPTTGTVCHYVATGNGSSRSLFVTARGGTSLPPSTAQDSAEVHGIGDAAVRTENALYARYGSRSYAFAVVPHGTKEAETLAEEVRLAKMVRPAMVAQNR
jgi:hypothetical protein